MKLKSQFLSYASCISGIQCQHVAMIAVIGQHTEYFRHHKKIYWTALIYIIFQI
jgi:hypothetical protein